MIGSHALRVAVRRLVLCAAALAAAVPPAPAQESASPGPLPPVGELREAALPQQGLHEWRVDLAANDFVALAVEAVGITLTDGPEWPDVRVIGPDGRVVYETSTPHATSSIDTGARIVVPFIADRTGTHRLRITARRQVSSQLPYRLQVMRHGPAGDADRVRLAVFDLWHEGARLHVDGSRDTRLVALQKYEAALPLAAQIGDEDLEALTLTTIASIHYQRSDPVPARAAASRALAIWTRLGRAREEALTLSDLGVIEFLAYLHPQARAYYDQALARFRVGQDPLGEAMTLVRLGWVEFAAGDMARVIELNQQALPLWRLAHDTGGESVTHNDFGRAYAELGDVSQALDAYRAALATRPGDLDPRGAAVTLMRMGQLHLNVADWQAAFETMHQALALARRAKDVRNESSILSNLGVAYSRVGDAEEAGRYLGMALTLARQVDNRTVQANVLATLGIEAYSKGELAQSRDYFQQALALQVAITDQRGQANTLRYLATTQLALGRTDEALASITASLDRSQAAQSPSGLATLAAVHDALGDHATALSAYERAIDRARQVRARDQEVSVLARYGRLLASLDRLDEARDALTQAVELHETLRAGLADADQRMHYASRAVTPYQAYIDVLMALEARAPGQGHAREAFRTAERARGRGLLDLLAASSVDLREGVDRDLLDRERSLRWRLNAKAAIQTSLLMNGQRERRLARLEQEIADLARAWRETSTAIRQQSPAYASLNEPEPLSADEVAGMLDDRTVLLEFAPGEGRSWLFAVTRSTFDSFPLPGREVIERAARDVHRLLTARQPASGDTPTSRQARIARADRDLRTRGAALSELVMGPIADRLAAEWRGWRLAVVAAGALEYVPIAALPPPRAAGPGTTMVARHEVVALPSASSLPFLRRDGPRRVAAKAIAIVADPVFEADDPRVLRSGQPPPPADPADATSAAIARASLTRLPFSRAEAQAVAAQVPASSLLQATDFEASLELATSGRLNDYRIVHLATHGLVDTARPELSGLALSLVDRNGRRRDGFLRLNTIYNLRLSADLVVLSACQTALGKEIAGEGLVGLTRGFMQAGARRVIASLWQVNDAATAELMTRFYAGLLQRRLTASAALRAAQREMAADPRWSAPYYWAGFVLQGDWQP